MVDCDDSLLQLSRIHSVGATVGFAFGGVHAEGSYDNEGGGSNSELHLCGFKG